MHVYRICRVAHVALDGEGARLYGGRWNSVGRAVVYASTSRSLAALEYLIHLDAEDAPDDLVLMTIRVPDAGTIARVDRGSLPVGWVRESEAPGCRERGDGLLDDGRALALLVPSAVIPEEENVLLNPRHARMPEVRVVEQRTFAFDLRLLG